MIAASDNIILEHLCTLRGDVGEVKNDMRAVNARLASIESCIATRHTDQTRTTVREDDIVLRVEPPEQRSSLVDA